MTEPVHKHWALIRDPEGTEVWMSWATVEERAEYIAQLPEGWFVAAYADGG